LDNLKEFSHDRWDIDRQKNSLLCEKNLSESIGFIILDDIVTTGTTISACKELLIDNGANEKNIVGLTIAETMLGYDLTSKALFKLVNMKNLLSYLKKHYLMMLLMKVL
jgi:adenine/guanine phosphoribosyltransferase-like PRPP-binding protein